MAKHIMQIQGRKGDEPIEWDVAVKEEVRTAEEKFGELLLGGHLAFSVNPEGDPRGLEGELIRTFDKHAERILMVPPLAGG